MEKKQGFLSSFKHDNVRVGSRSGSGLLDCLKKKHHQPHGTTSFEPLMWRSGSLTLSPLMEGPDPEGGEPEHLKRGNGSGLGQWVKDQLHRTSSSVSGSMTCSRRRADLRMLLGVLGAPLAPVHVSTLDPLPILSIKNTPIETSSAQYILQQYTAASGGQKLQNSIKSAYAMGKVRMTTSEFETAEKVTKNRSSAQTGGFVLWQMDPDMWYVELAVGASKVRAGCDGKLVWKHTSWLGGHTAKGPVRPLRRALQGLDPRTTATLFANAKCIGEKKLDGEDCFILKLCSDPQTLKARSEGPAEIIRHVLFGYFSQKTALLVYMEDSHLTRVQSSGGDTIYWETTICSFLNDYRSVEGIMIAHSGCSIVTLFRFGEMAMSHTRTRMEESWTIDEVVFNVPGLSSECFIPPADLKSGSEEHEISRVERGKNLSISTHRAKVAALERELDYGSTGIKLLINE